MIHAEILELQGTECFVVVSSMITPVGSVVETLRYQLTIVTVVFLVLSVILAIIVASHIAKPLVTINSSVK
jgi:membrane protein implicated in regulation of membrane protease activity